jgi:hypothetical protein
LVVGGIKIRTLVAIGNTDATTILYGVGYLLTMVIFVLENIKRPMDQAISLNYVSVMEGLNKSSVTAAHLPCLLSSYLRLG